MAISVVLHGDANDKATLRTAVRFAAQQSTSIRLILGPDSPIEHLEKYLRLCCWDVENRLGLSAPPFTIERSEAAQPWEEPSTHLPIARPIRLESWLGIHSLFMGEQE